ncbi:INO80 complex subunit 3 [Colletotrichum chlorophyti]|uniref:INO80 complex subunit 3 n=1 Tax=Colletotrichum chlorophyti TaxID=708187 RepID=A0A1Q8RMS1_9PEZI|nr:INO80 complex subunit 3 [Colletotrichum chlorophyti]
MSDSNGSVAANDVKAEGHDSDDGRTGDGKTTYKSWKKKYRKMRITFDQKMHDCEELHRQESQALATAKRIAIENDRILDLLLDMNSSAQIPLDKRVDISQDPPADIPYPAIDVDQVKEHPLGEPTKSLKTLLKDVPHFTYSQAKEHSPSVVADMEPFAGHSNPPSFLTTDDIDDYLHDIDRRIDPDNLLPTLAPVARTNAPLPETNPHALSQSIAMKNPTSVYNWLRKHAPKTFLQDAENAAAAADDESHHPGETPQTDGRKKRGGARGEGSRGGRGSRGGKRASLAAVRAEKAAQRAAEKAAAAAERAAALRRDADSYDLSMDDEAESDGASFATPATSRGKRKRAGRDDDEGYRPRGSSSRPTKKKRKSEGADVGTPTVSKRGRKSDRERIED